MKTLFFIHFFLLNSLFAQSSYNFLKREAVKSSKNYIYNEYENIINGSIAFVVGNVGYFSTDSETLKISYSFVQTIGILNVGKGLYDYNRLLQDKELYLLLKKNKDLKKEKIANGIVRIFAYEERAKRRQMLWSSALLATQYFINAQSNDTPSELKSIYQFLGGINLIVIGYSYFYQEKYERFYFSKKKKYSLFPFYTKHKNKHYAGLGYNYRF